MNKKLKYKSPLVFSAFVCKTAESEAMESGCHRTIRK